MLRQRVQPACRLQLRTLPLLLLVLQRLQGRLRLQILCRRRQLRVQPFAQFRQRLDDVFDLRAGRRARRQSTE